MDRVDTVNGDRQNEILVLGDSHADVFAHESMAGEFADCAFNVVSVGGATISGLENPNSKTQAMPIFKSALDASKAGIVITLLGEVDTGFVIWYRAEKHNVPVHSMRDVALRNYERFLLELRKERAVICVSSPLPTIKDDNDWGEVANARREVKANQLQRTELTMTFNRSVQRFCQENGLDFLMLDQDSIGADGLVRADLRNHDPRDHHYDQSAYARLIAGALRPVLADLMDDTSRLV